MSRWTLSLTFALVALSTTLADQSYILWTNQPKSAEPWSTSSRFAIRETTSGPGACAWSRTQIDVPPDTTPGRGLTILGYAPAAGSTEMTWLAHGHATAEHVGYYHQCVTGEVLASLYGTPTTTPGIEGSAIAKAGYVLVRNLDGVETVLSEKKIEASAYLKSADRSRQVLDWQGDHFFEVLDDFAYFKERLSYSLSVLAKTGASFTSQPHCVGDARAKACADCPSFESSGENHDAPVGHGDEGPDDPGHHSWD